MMRNRRDFVVRFLVPTLAGALLLPACQTEGPAPGTRVPRGEDEAPLIRMNSVGILDRSIAIPGRERSALAVEATSARRTPTGTLEVWVTLRNRTNLPLQLEARTHFFDGTEYPVEPPSQWTRLFLHGNSLAHYKEFSTNIGDVAYYYVEVRRAL